METEIKKKEWEQLKDAKKAAGGRTPRRTSTGVQVKSVKQDSADLLVFLIFDGVSEWIGSDSGKLQE